MDVTVQLGGLRKKTPNLIRIEVFDLTDGSLAGTFVREAPLSALSQVPSKGHSLDQRRSSIVTLV